MSTITYAFSHVVTHITDKMLQSLLKIIIWSGLNQDKILSEWKVLSAGIHTWITSGHFISAVLEIYDPRTNKLIRRWDIAVDYELDDDEMWVDIESIKYTISKLGLHPSSCRYEIIVTTKSGRPHVDGWSNGSFRSTEGLQRFSIGSISGAGTLGTRMSYYK